VKFFFALLSCTFMLPAQTTIKHLNIHDNDFYIITDTYDIYDSKGEVMKFYREENTYDMTHLFNLTLEDKTGTCGARSVEEGSYEIDGDTLTLYTLWERQGRIYDVPYGARIQHYRIENNGTLTLVSSKLYVETARKSFDRSSGMRFLWESPKSDADKKAFTNYIASVEQQYKGTFIFGDDAKALIKEVKTAISRRNLSRWK